MALSRALLQHWNTVTPLSLLVTTACSIPEPASESTGSEATSSGSPQTDTGSESDAGTQTSSESETETGPECSSDLDCPGSEVCVEGVCEGPPYQDSYAPPPSNACDDNRDCEIGHFCQEHFGQNYYGLCLNAAPTPTCPTPELVEIPLPPEAEGVIDLQFANIDADAPEELVLLTEDSLVIVDDDASLISVEAFDEPGEWELALIRADLDELDDLLLTRSDEAQGLLRLGLGASTFGPALPGPMRALSDPVAADWIPGDAEELIALDALSGRYHVFSGPFDGALGIVELIDHLPEGVSVFAGTGEAQPHIGAWENDDLLEYTPGDLDYDQPFRTAFTHEGRTALGYFESLNAPVLTGIDVLEQQTLLALPLGISYLPLRVDKPFVLDLVGYESDELLFYDGEQPALLLFSSQPEQPGLDCRAVLDALPVPHTLAKGDLDGDGHDELALVSAVGELSVWTRAE